MNRRIRRQILIATGILVGFFLIMAAIGQFA